MSKQTWWQLLAKPALEELHAMLRDPDITYTDVGELYGRSSADVSYYANKLGLPQRRPRQGSPRGPRNGPVATLSQVDRELAELAAQQEKLSARREELKAKKAELQVRFEHSGKELLVYGIADGPLAAPIEGWMAFLLNEGPRKLREYVTATGKKGGA